MLSTANQQQKIFLFLLCEQKARAKADFLIVRSSFSFFVEYDKASKYTNHHIKFISV